jgi:hypothetical protein
MTRLILALACVVAMAPGVASAALSLAISADINVCAEGEQFFDLVFNETGTPVNEGLFAYDLYITRDKPGINLIRAEKPDDWVFTSLGASFQEAGPEFSNKPGLIVVNAIGDLLGANQDIQDGTKVARVFYTIDPDAAPGIYHVSLDPAGTLFVSGDTGEAIPVDISDSGTVITEIIPEPTALPLLAVGGVLAVRRRRRSVLRV